MQALLVVFLAAAATAVVDTTLVEVTAAKRNLLSATVSASRASGRSSLGAMKKKKPKGPNPEKPPQDEVRVMPAQ